MTGSKRQHHRRAGQGRLLDAAVLGVCLSWSAAAQAQLGMLTAVVGEGRHTRADGSGAWEAGIAIEEGDRIETAADSYAMAFFVSGMRAAELQFEGTIVVEVDHNSDVEVRRGPGRRAPIDIHVRRGRARAFFDAEQHKDYILLSTPQGTMRVTGSVIYVAHDDADGGSSEFGSFDSQCSVVLDAGSEFTISRSQKVRVGPQGQGEVTEMTVADTTRWKNIPDLNLRAAMSQRDPVRSAYVGRTWVGEYVTGGERLEDVASEQSSNIPSQEPVVSSSAPTSGSRVDTAPSRDTRPRLRASGGGRSVGGDEDGIGRETLSLYPARILQPPTMARRQAAARALGAARPGRATVGATRSGATRRVR